MSIFLAGWLSLQLPPAAAAPAPSPDEELPTRTVRAEPLPDEEPPTRTVRAEPLPDEPPTRTVRAVPLPDEPTAPTPAPAEPEQRPWVVGGFIDTQYVINSNFPDNHIFRGTAVTSRTGEFNPNLMVAYIRRDPIKSPWMMELALQAGSAADALYAAEPVAGGADGRYAGAEAFKHIGRANSGVRLKRGTEFAAGLMVAPTHFGSFWTKDNWHSSISWGYSSVPFFLMGIRVYQPIGERFGVGAWLANAYGFMGDNNKAPVGLLNFVFNARPDLQVVQNVYAGPEDADLRPAAWRLLLDTQVVYNSEKWGLALVGDYGREQLTFKTDSPLAQWANGMVSLRWRNLAREKVQWGMAIRPEFFWDRGGRIFNSPDPDNWLLGGTFTNDLRFFDALMLRLEYRYDYSTAPSGFFYRGKAINDAAAGLANSQHTVIFNFIGYFERRFAGLHG
jgi:hypothetical protein